MLLLISFYKYLFQVQYLILQPILQTIIHFTEMKSENINFGNTAVHPLPPPPLI